MTGRRTDGTNPRAMGTNPKALGTNPNDTGASPRQRGTNPRAQGTNPRALKAQLDRIETTQEQILRTLDRLTRQQRLGEHGPVTLDDGTVFLPGTGTIGQRTLSDEARAALDALEQTDDHQPAPPAPERTTP